MTEEEKRRYSIVSYNIKDSSGEFTYMVKLSDHIAIEPDTGYLHCYDAIVGNVGIQTYKGYELGFADGERIVKVHRKREYIFAKDSLATLEGKPITLRHPSENVTSKNIRQYGMGTILDTGREDGDNILCDLIIHDQELIDKIYPEDEFGERHISNEFRDLSLGYSATLLPYEGTDEYIQTDIKYNHLAVVEEGRAANAMIVDSKNKEIKEKKRMNLFNLFKGKKLKINDDDTVTIIDEEKVVSKEKVTVESEYKNEWDGKVVKTKRETTEVVTEDDEKEKIEEDEKEKEKVAMKDRKYFDEKFAFAINLPDGAYKADLIDSLNKEYEKAFPKEIKDTEPKKVEAKDSVLNTIKPTKTEELVGKEFKDKEPERVDFKFLDQESAIYYDKLTNPESGYHKNHKEWKEFYDSEMRSGKTNLNIR